VAYNSLLLRRRREIHERIGGAIEELYPDRLEEFYEMLAYHYSRSDDSEKAYQYLRLSSIKTGARNSIIESVRLGREAVDVLNRMPQTDENKRRAIEMRLLLSGPLGGTGQMGDALQMMEEGAKLAEEVGDNRSLADLCGTISLSHTFSGDNVRGVEYAERAFHAAERTGDAVLMATNGWELCGACIWRGEHTRVVEVAPGVLDLLEKEEIQRRSDLGKYYNFNLYSAILSYWGTSLGFLGQFEQGQTVCEKACRFAEEVGNLYASAVAQFMYTGLLCLKGDGRGAIEHMENCLGYAEQGQTAIILWAAPTLLGFGCYLLGELDTARQHLERRLEIHRGTPYPLMLSMNYYLLGMVSLDLGNPEAARSHIEESLRLARKHGEMDQEGRSTVALGGVIGKADPSGSARAEELVLKGIKLLEESKHKPYEAEGYLYLGELHGDTGQKQRALEALEKAQGMFQEMGMDYWVRRTQSVMRTLQA
jgi:tetratricopeptide (TPR) repeat protein